MSSPERGLEYYRQFFVDPSKPIDQSFLSASQFLTTQLLGNPESSSVFTSGADYDGFVNELAERMSLSRHFDAKSMGQLHPNGFAPAILAHEASTLRNNNTVSIQSSPAETEMEKEALSWLIENISRYDTREAGGAFTTGGTLSNLTALLAAREKLAYEKNWDGRKPAAVLTTDMAHYSVAKAAKILGPSGLIEVVEVTPDENGYKMSVKNLKEKVVELEEQNIPIMAIVAVAGQTETGLVEDLENISTIAQESDIFLHIDGAYGCPYVLSKRGTLFNGMDRGDSLSVDPHKYLYTPYPAGSIMFKNGQDQDYVKALNKGGDAYVLGEFLGDHLGKGRIEGSMGGQGAAAALAVIKILGTEGLGVVLDHNIDLTDLAYRTLLLPESSFQPAYVPELNTISFYPRSKEMRIDGKIEETARLLEERTGSYLSTEILPISDGVVDGERKVVKSRVFRMVVSHPYTDQAIIENALSDLERIWSEVIRT